MTHHIPSSKARGIARERQARKDYGCPLRIYGCKNSTFRYTALPPRSARAAEAHKLASGWRALYCPALQSSAHVAALHLTVQQAGPHLGKRIAWAELPPAVQAALRASFLGEYCPKEEV